MVETRKCIGILNETYNVWERRVALNPQAVQTLVQKGYKVIVQPSDQRCFLDQEFKDVGANIQKDLSEASVIFGVKPQVLGTILPEKTYLMYSRAHNAMENDLPLFRELLEKKCSLIDYEQIKDDSGRGVIGSAFYAGAVGAFDIFQYVGEFFLMKKSISTPFLYSRGAAYLHKDY